MDGLRQLLNVFWKWSGISFEDYINDIPPTCSEVTHSDWEMEFPEINELVYLAKEEILNLKDTSDNKVFSTICEAISIDIEFEEIKDFAFENLSDQILHKFCFKGLNFPHHYCRYQIVAGLRDYKPPFAKNLLMQVLSNSAERNEVLSPALYALNHLK